METARMQAVRIPTMYGWFNHRQQEGVIGLAITPKLGRPVQADEAYCRAFARVLEQVPIYPGYYFGVSSMDYLRQHLINNVRIALNEPHWHAAKVQRVSLHRPNPRQMRGWLI